LAKTKFPKLPFWVEEGGDDYVNNLANEVEAQTKRMKNEDGDGGEENYLFREDVKKIVAAALASSDPLTFSNSQLIVNTFMNIGRGGEGRLATRTTTK
jgi:hypothetical protein